MKKYLSLLDRQDFLTVSGLLMLGYGVYRISPPAAFIVLGLIFLAPVMIPSLLAMWRAK